MRSSEGEERTRDSFTLSRAEEEESAIMKSGEEKAVKTFMNSICRLLETSLEQKLERAWRGSGNCPPMPTHTMAQVKSTVS